MNSYDVDLLYFIDDDFLARPRKETEAFIDMYSDFRIPFWFNTRPEHCTTEVLEKLKDVGLFRASFGIESGNEGFRIKRLGRKVSNDELLRCFKTIDQSGIQYSINCMIGFPYETRDLVFDTIKFVRQIKGYDAITVSTFTPYRGTVLREQAIEAKWLDPDRLTVHTTATSMLEMPGFTAKQIEGLIQTFPLYVEFDEYFWAEIGRIERFEPGSEEILEKYSRLYQKRRWS